MIKIKRESNFELLRIISMFMIVVLHVLNHGGIYKSTNIYSNDFIIVNLIESLSIVGVNCFVLISGYFGINSRFSFRKCMKIYIQVIFYSIIINYFAFVRGVIPLDKYTIIKMIFPITTKVWWFITVYIVLYLLSPYINKLIKSLKFEEIHKLIVILFIILIILSSLVIIPNPIDNSGGYSLYNFIYLYIIGAYIKLYYDNKNFDKKITFGVYLLLVVLLSTFNVCISRFKGADLTIYQYNFLPIFFSSISLFLFFKEIKISSKVINFISSLTFGVYLFHDNPIIRQNIYNFFEIEGKLSGGKLILYIAFVAISIYTISSIIELLRKLLFKFIISAKNRLS